MYFKIYFIPVIKAEISASLLRSWVSHDSSEIILYDDFDAQKTLIMLKTVVYSLFSGFFD